MLTRENEAKRGWWEVNATNQRSKQLFDELVLTHDIRNALSLILIPAFRHLLEKAQQ